MLYLQSDLLRQQGVVHGFSVRLGGVSAPPFDSLNLGKAVGDNPAAVDRNRAILFDAAGIDAAAFASVNQVHGDRVVFARREDTLLLSSSRAGPVLDGRVDADAIVAAPGASVGVRTADCVPILIYDPRSGASAAVHAGWRGTVARIVSRAVAALAEAFASKPAELLAAIGPAIGPCCFEVGQEVVEQFDAAVVRPGRHVDLPLANARLLEACGLLPSRIDVLGRCTYCERELFFSHRRDHGRTGRHLSFIQASGA